MNPLALFLGGGWTGLAACTLAGSLLGGVGAWKVQEWRHDSERADALQEANRLNGKRASVTAQTDTKTVAAQQRIRTVTVETIKEVPTYVSANDCPMSPGFRVHHDAAAAGRVPDPARIADAAAVPAPVIASTVAENYGACLEIAQRLTDLQGWVRGQQDVR